VRFEEKSHLNESLVSRIDTMQLAIDKILI